MSGAVYVCSIGCMEDCSHGVTCMVYASDAEHPHPERHIGHDFGTNKMHEWRSDGKRRVCRITEAQ